MILYEHPFNERMRTWLRLEDLFDKFFYFLQQTDPRQHHVALTTLFEITEVAARSDLKSELLQELERQRQILNGLRNHPGVEPDTLANMLNSVESAMFSLAATQGKTGQHLRDNEWIMSIRSRSAIPGGACEFDLPAYHAWQHRPAELRARDIYHWAASLFPLQDSLVVVLKLLRESGRMKWAVAQNGAFQKTLGGKPYQLMRVRLPIEQAAIPEISANKYMLSIRFFSQDGDLRPRPLEAEVTFEIALCSL